MSVSFYRRCRIAAAAAVTIITELTVQIGSKKYPQIEHEICTTILHFVVHLPQSLFNRRKIEVFSNTNYSWSRCDNRALIFIARAWKTSVNSAWREDRSGDQWRFPKRYSLSHAFSVSHRRHGECSRDPVSRGEGKGVVGHRDRIRIHDTPTPSGCRVYVTHPAAYTCTISSRNRASTRMSASWTSRCSPTKLWHIFRTKWIEMSC